MVKNDYNSFFDEADINNNNNNNNNSGNNSSYNNNNNNNNNNSNNNSNMNENSNQYFEDSDGIFLESKDDSSLEINDETAIIHKPYFNDSGFGDINKQKKLTHTRGKHTFTEAEKLKMAKYESLDFPIIDNQIYREHLRKTSKLNHILKTFGKWLICFMIGVLVGITAYVVKQSVEFVNEYKFKKSEHYLETQKKFIGFLVYYGINLLFGISASLVIIPVGQIASGSGIPEVKGYLNGIRIPHSMNVKTLIGKLASLILAYSSGLILGPEGPMIHIGSMLGGAIGQVKSKTLRWYPKIFWKYHNDRDRRDFISTGAAAGVAAAFGAPIGGVLFGYEEASSFWSRQLTWRTFFACLIATFTTNIILQGFSVQIHDYGVLKFGLSNTVLFRYAELIPFAGIGVLGGLLGALFVDLNARLSKWRASFFANKKIYLRVVEVFILVTFTSTLLFCAAAFTPCRDISQAQIPNNNNGSSSSNNGTIIEKPIFIPFFCEKDKSYNQMAGLSFNSLDAGLRLLFSTSPNIFTIPVLIIFTLISFILTIITSGLMLASGLFIPMMLVGASLGRLVGQVIALFFSNIDPCVYAMVGASAMMAGFSRMTISLAIIIVELTEGTQYMLPVILSVMIAKWVGDIFNESIYEHLMEQKCYPFLQSQPIKSFIKLGVVDIMKSDVVTVHEVEKVSRIIEILKSTQHLHHGFPVVERPILNNQRDAYGNLQQYDDETAYSGLILRNQLVVLLYYKIFCHEQPIPQNPRLLGGNANRKYPQRRFGRVTDYGHVQADPRMSYELMTQSLARHFPPIDKMNITQDEIDNMYIDLRPYMNLSSIVANETYSYSETYQLFRTMGLRHLPVLNKRSEVVGIVSRKDLL
ncbi:hypothetical protein DICPUDRAFT_93809 [Dictyostelium purpureum]|uniref:Chloride channel protein n=1 Tax=Dictyostelium purpureum TaxID=5786 RepID=F0ZBX4_DICPU|nr:uncharacterized protein DICPUDRAFT_93809 [Dictyostelium purpureum]EGC38534.1 hypothetical protein DICPUDRAFT_93809 [Dictyostelium purpureum]|eukprot:XP_003284905.1 hypothetical protein DICPUDRAFT_93809 [Dictyostelium purpureum]